MFTSKNNHPSGILFIHIDCNLEFADPCKISAKKAHVSIRGFNEKESGQILPPCLRFRRIYLAALFCFRAQLVFFSRIHQASSCQDLELIA